MPRYQVDDPATGLTVSLEGDSPPTEEELKGIFSEVAKRAPTQWTNLGLKGIIPAALQAGEIGIGETLKGAAYLAGQGRPRSAPTGDRFGLEGAYAPSPPPTPFQSYLTAKKSPLYQAGQTLIDVAPEAHPIPPETERGVLTRAAGMAGGFIAPVAAGPFAPVQMAAQAIGGHLDTDFEEAKAKGVSDEDAADLAMKRALTSGMTAGAIWTLMPKFLRNATDRWIVDRFAPTVGEKVVQRFLLGRAAAVTEGAGLGAASQLGENIASGHPILQGVPQAAAGMGIMQGLMPRGRTPKEAEDLAALAGPPPAGVTPPPGLQAWAATFSPRAPEPAPPEPPPARPARTPIITPFEGPTVSRPGQPIVPAAPRREPPAVQVRAASRILSRRGVDADLAIDLATEFAATHYHDAVTEQFRSDLNQWFDESGFRDKGSNRWTNPEQMRAEMKARGWSDTEIEKGIRDSFEAEQKAIARNNRDIFARLQAAQPQPGEINAPTPRSQQVSQEEELSRVAPRGAIPANAPGAREGGGAEANDPNRVGQGPPGQAPGAAQAVAPPAAATPFQPGEAVTVRDPASGQERKGAYRAVGEGGRAVVEINGLEVEFPEGWLRREVGAPAAPPGTQPPAPSADIVDLPSLAPAAFKVGDPVDFSDARAKLQGKIVAVNPDSVVVEDANGKRTLVRGQQTIPLVEKPSAPPAETSVTGAVPVWLSQIPKSAKPLSEGAEPGNGLIRQLWDSYQRGNEKAGLLLGPETGSLHLTLAPIRELIRFYPSKLREAIAADRTAPPAAELGAPATGKKAGQKITHFAHKDGKGLLDRSAWDLSKLTEDEELELPELLDFGLQQPIDVPAGSKFYFTEEGLKKHAKLIRLIRKASKTGLVKEQTTLSGKPVWESNDGQLAIPKEQPPAAPPAKPAEAPEDAQIQAEIEKEKTGTGPLSPQERVELNELRITRESRGKLAILNQTRLEWLEQRERESPTKPAAQATGEGAGKPMTKAQQAAMESANKAADQLLELGKKYSSATMPQRLKKQSESALIRMRAAAAKLGIEVPSAGTWFMPQENARYSEMVKRRIAELQSKPTAQPPAPEAGKGPKLKVSEGAYERDIYTSAIQTHRNPESTPAQKAEATRILARLDRMYPKLKTWAEENGYGGVGTLETAPTVPPAAKGLTAEESARLEELQALADANKPMTAAQRKQRDALLVKAGQKPKEEGPGGVQAGPRSLLPGETRTVPTGPEFDEARKALQDTLDWMEKKGLFEKFPGLKTVIVRDAYPSEQVLGEPAGVFRNLPEGGGVMKFLEWSRSDTPLHEFMHWVENFLGREDRNYVKALRREALLKVINQVPDEHAGRMLSGDMTSDDFLATKVGMDFYHLANDSEFFAWLMTKKGMEEMAKPEARTFVEKIQAGLKQLWQAIKDRFGLSAREDAMWRKILAGKMPYRTADGVKFEGARKLSLARNPKEAASEVVAAQDLTEGERTEVAADLEVQNAWAETMAERLLVGAPAGAARKLNQLFGKRVEALKVGRGAVGQSPVHTFDELMANPDIQPAQKQIVAGSLAQNLWSFLAQRDALEVRAESKITEYQAEIKKLAGQISDEGQKRDQWRKTADQIAVAYHGKQTERLRAAEQAGATTEMADARRNIERLRQSNTSIRRVLEMMGRTLSDEFLSRPNLTASDVLDEFYRVNGGNEAAVLRNMNDAGIGIGQDYLRTVAELMLGSDDLASRVLDIRAISDPESAAEIDRLSAELRSAAKQGKWNEMQKMLRQVSGATTPLDLARLALRRLQPALTRAVSQLGDWESAQGVIGQTKTDAEFKRLQERVFANFDVQAITRTSDGYTMTFKDPITGKDVVIDPGISKLKVESAKQGFKDFFDNAAAYVAGYEANPGDPKYDVRRVAAMRSLIENKEFYLNPAMNPSVPHFLPYAFDLLAWLRDPMSVLRNVAGMAANFAAVRVNAMNKVYRLALQHINDPRKGLGLSNEITRRAAEKAGMTPREWQDHVGSELLASVQRTGSAPIRRGERTLSGHVVTQEDWDAIRSQYLYERGLRVIAEEAGGYTGARSLPARVIVGGEVGMQRRGMPTGLMTVTRKRSARANRWADDWLQLKTNGERVAFLDDEDNFRRIVMGHLQKMERPAYTIKTPFASVYRDALRDHLGENGPTSIAELTQYIHDRQDFSPGNEANIRTPGEIQGQILTEIDKALDNYRKEGTESAKPKPTVRVMSAENAFSRPRSQYDTAPDTFYDLGIADYSAGIREANDAKAWYTVAALEGLRTLDGALREQMGRIKADLEAGKTSKKELRQEARRGEQFYNYATLNRNARRIHSILRDAERAWGLPEEKSAASRVFNRLQSAVGGEILLNPATRTTHTFGMFGVSAAVNMQLQNALIRPQMKAWGRFFANGFKDVASHFAGRTDSLSQAVARNLNDPTFTGNLLSRYLEMVLRRRDEVERLKELAILPRDDIAKAWNKTVDDFANIFKNRQQEPFLRRLNDATASVVDVHNEFLRAYSPVKYNDYLLNSDIRSQRMDIVRDLQVNAMEAFANRRELINAPDWDDLTKPANLLTDEEITGSKGSLAKREAANKRRAFTVTGLSLDALMMRYWKSVSEVQARGEDASGVPFLSDGEEASLDFQLALERGLNTPGTRNLAAQGGTLRRSLGFIHGLPLYSMGRHLAVLNRLSTESNARAALVTAATALPILVALAAYGLMKIQTSDTLNRALFNQATSNPTLVNARTPEDYARLITRATANWFAGIGDIVNGAILKQPDRMGHLDSMFVMWGFVMDLVNATGDGLRTGDWGHAMGSMAKRWLPLQAKTYEVATGDKSGLREHRNAMAAISAAMPPSMEGRAYSGAGAKATSATPSVYAAIDALYKNDPEAFEKAHQEYLADRAAHGVKNPDAAWRAAIMARDPWTAKLGRLPNESERELILSRMGDQQKADIAKAEEAFSRFGELSGARVHFTQEQAESDRGGALAGRQSLPGIGAGLGGGTPGLGSAGRVGSGMGVPRGTMPKRGRVSLGGALQRPRLVSGRLARPRLSRGLGATGRAVTPAYRRPKKFASVYRNRRRHARLYA